MAEATGIVLGAVSLAGLFNNVVDCFEYIQVARRFGDDFQTVVLRLDTAQLRLTRWGQSIGLTQDVANLPALPESLGSAEDIDTAQRLLGQILVLFEEAQRRAKKFSGGEEAVFDEGSELNSGALSLHQKMRQMCLRRQKKTGLRSKAKWALSDSNNLKRLIGGITDLIGDLIELYPGAQASQETLCVAEVSELQSEERLPALREVAAEQDPLLAESITRAAPTKTVTYNTTFTGNNSGVQIGVNKGNVNNAFGK